MESLFGRCNVPIAHHKTEGPATSVTFLGIQIDTITSKLHLPAEKVHRLQALLTSWQSRRACTQKELESLAGHLCHAAVVIRPGRGFLCTLFSFLSCVSHPSHFIRLNLEVRADLTWWRHLLYYWNSFSFFPLPTPSSHVYSEASGSFGCGAFCTKWLQLPWPNKYVDVGIAAKELVPIMIAAAVWGPAWSGHHVRFHCNNEAVVSVIQRRAARLPLLVQLLRCLFFYASVYHFDFSSCHIPGVSNSAADAISRNQLSYLSFLLPQVPRVAISTAVADFLLSPPDWESSSWTGQFIRSLLSPSPLKLPAVTGPATAAIMTSAPHLVYPNSQ